MTSGDAPPLRPKQRCKFLALFEGGKDKNSRCSRGALSGETSFLFLCHSFPSPICLSLCHRFEARHQTKSFWHFTPMRCQNFSGVSCWRKVALVKVRVGKDFEGVPLPPSFAHIKACPRGRGWIGGHLHGTAEQKCLFKKSPPNWVFFWRFWWVGS